MTVKEWQEKLWSQLFQEGESTKSSILWEATVWLVSEEGGPVRETKTNKVADGTPIPAAT